MKRLLEMRKGTLVVFALVVGLSIGYLGLVLRSNDAASTQRQLRAAQTALANEQAQLVATTQSLAQVTAAHAIELARFCRDERAQYTGQIVYTRFLAREFHATKQATDRGVADLRAVIGKRPPKC